jgi:hypothetical protein
LFNICNCNSGLTFKSKHYYIPSQKLYVFHKRKFPKLTSKMQVSFVNEVPTPFCVLSCIKGVLMSQSYLNYLSRHLGCEYLAEQKNSLPLYCWDAGGGVVPLGGVGGGWGAPRGGGSGGGAPESPFWLAGEYFRLTNWWLLTTDMLLSWPPIPFEWVWWAGTRGGGSKWCERGGSAGGAPPLVDSAPIFASERLRSSSAISARPPVWCKALLLRSCNTKINELASGSRLSSRLSIFEIMYLVGGWNNNQSKKIKNAQYKKVTDIYHKFLSCE